MHIHACVALWPIDYEIHFSAMFSYDILAMLQLSPPVSDIRCGCAMPQGGRDVRLGDVNRSQFFCLRAALKTSVAIFIVMRAVLARLIITDSC